MTSTTFCINKSDAWMPPRFVYADVVSRALHYLPESFPSSLAAELKETLDEEARPLAYVDISDLSGTHVAALRRAVSRVCSDLQREIEGPEDYFGYVIVLAEQLLDMLAADARLSS